MRIGVVLDSFESSYQETLVRWLETACRDNGLRLVVMAGGGLGANHHAAPQRNTIYEWIAPQSALDGLVLLGGTLVRERALVQGWCDRLRSMPMCSIGLQLEGVPSILTDNGDGVRQMVRHLVTDHGLRRLAFVGGPAGNQEARERLEAFRDELTQLGLNGDDAPHAEGDFRAPSGREAASQLFAQYPDQLDGILAANDYMAMGVLEALSVLGAPHRPRIAVAGFDDIDEAAFTTPPLTTVQQPMRQLAELAVESILAQLAGEAREPVSRLPALPRIRRSCGCKERVPLRARAKARPGAESFDVIMKRRSDEIAAELQRISDGLFVGMSGWDAHLVEAFIEQARGVPGDLFLNAIDRMVLTLIERQSEVWRFHAVLTALRAVALDAMSGDALARLDAEELFHAARVITGAGAMRAEARLQGDAQERHRLLNSMATRLFACIDAASVRAALDETLPAFNLRQAFIMTLAGRAPDAVPQATLWYSLDAQCDPSDFNHPFPAHELLPAAVWESLRSNGMAANWIVLPLFARRAILGYAVLALVHHTGAAYETLRVNLSAALASAGLERSP
jgi:sigma-B regulation protein RsbU (phosphoserine phosphatase)